MIIINLTEEEYNDFMRCLTILKEICNDVDIRNGIIRQRSNDLTSVFEMDLTSLITEASIPITNLKKKIDVFKTFVGQAVSIEIHEAESVGDSYFIVSDDQTSIKFLFPTLEFMDNKMISQEELDNIFKLEEENLILSNNLNNIITDRIRVVTDNFNTQAIQVKFDGDKASITASTQSKDQYANFKSDIPMNIDFDGEFSSNLSTIPFGVEHDIDLDFKMYKEEDQNICLNRISTELSSVAINIYSRSAIVEG